MAKKLGPGDDLAMMHDCVQWPAWPYLPIKQRKASGGMPDCAVLVAGNGATIYHGNMWDGITEQTPTTVYKTFDEILAAGWEVD